MKVTIGPYKDEGDRKISVMIHDYDTWSMDHTLAYIVHPMLIQLKETKHGAPNVDKEDVPESLWPNEAEESLYAKNGQTDIHFFARWDWIMDEMIWAFGEILNDDGESSFWGEWIEDESKTLGGYHKSIDWDGLKEYQARMANGFRLFGKYYQSLWD